MTRELFEIAPDLERIDLLYASCDGNPDKLREVEDEFGKWIQSLAAEEGLAIDRVIDLIRWHEGKKAAAQAEVDAREEGLKHWKSVVKRADGSVGWYTKLLKVYLSKRGLTDITTATNRTVSIQKNGGKIPVIPVPDLDLNQVPEEFVRVTKELNKDKVREALEGGTAWWFAKLGEAGTSLRIR